MALHRSSVAMLVMVAVLLGSTPTFLAAAEETDAAAPEQSTEGRVPLPVIPRGQGENCVEDTDFMRRNHMDMLKHQRDETTLLGIRTEQYSLKECVACHTVAGPDEMPVTVTSEKHFCRSCHDYTAVKIDCFQCHASRPEPQEMTDSHNDVVVGAAAE